MYYLAEIFPFVRKIRIPLSRDQIMLLMLALNMFLLGFETYTAHIISGTIVPYEWIPIIFGPIAGFFLLLAGLVAFRRRNTAVIIANIVFLGSIVVGLLGTYFHWRRIIQPTAPLGETVSIPLIIWETPLLAPLTFALIGWIGISAVWIEEPIDSGILNLFGNRRLALPYSKTRAFFFMVGLGSLATVISSVLDHARTNFANPWLWVPTVVGVFGTTVALVLGAIKSPMRSDITTYAAAMAMMILTGLLGSWLHYQQDLTSQGFIVLERFIRGAPILAPMLFADMGGLGLIILLDPETHR